MTNAAVLARVRGLDREQDGRAWLAWHVEAFARAKKLPKLDKIMRRKRPACRQTMEQQIAIAQRWTAALTRQDQVLNFRTE